MTAFDDNADAGVLILGAEGRIGRTLAALLDGARLAARVPTRPGVIRVTDYADLPSTLFDGIDVVINCAGIIRGNDAELSRINAAMPEAAARTARLAGVRRFIHVSSMSVYGHARAIDATTVEVPMSAYGRSKAAGDAALSALNSKQFETAMLRLPAIVGPGVSGKTARLLKAWALTSVMPIPRGDVRRSMIGLDMTARCLAVIARSCDTGIVLAADPLPFGYASAAEGLRVATGRRLMTIALPRPMIALMSRATPAAAASLWADSLLDPAANLAVRQGMDSTLYANLAAMIAPAGPADQ
jgi:nucleoside-diphosphate-sugar epimerase